MSKETVAERDTTPEVAALRAKYVMPLPGPMYSKPVQIVKGRGQFVFDEKGRQYLDGFAGVATVSIGHSHPHWLSRIKAQMDVHHVPLPSPFAGSVRPAVWSARSRRRSCRSAFTNSGSEANELAALIAKNQTGNHEFIALRHAYRPHAHDDGADRAIQLAPFHALRPERLFFPGQ